MGKGAKEKWRKSTLDAVLKEERLSLAPYDKQHARMKALEAEGRIKPVKASPSNGKKPSLHAMWWVRVEVRDDAPLLEELDYRLHFSIDRSWWRHNLASYQKARERVLALSAFLAERKDLLTKPASVNARSFQIWNDEKFLKSQAGKSLLEHCGLELEKELNAFPTAEPFASRAIHRRTPQNVLVLENLDPFCSLRRLLVKEQRPLLGMEFGTIAYGGGFSAVATFRDFAAAAEPYLLEDGCRFFYAGDIDWKGLGIYESAAKAFAVSGRKLEPFVPAYAKMLAMAEADGRELQPCSHEPQNCPEFFRNFPAEIADKIRRVLNAGRRIPQEIMTALDWERE